MLWGSRDDSAHRFDKDTSLCPWLAVIVLDFSCVSPKWQSFLLPNQFPNFCRHSMAFRCPLCSSTREGKSRRPRVMSGLRSPLKSLTPSDVGQWLRQENLGCFADEFEADCVCGEMVEDLRSSDLDEFSGTPQDKSRLMSKVRAAMSSGGVVLGGNSNVDINSRTVACGAQSICGLGVHEVAAWLRQGGFDTFADAFISDEVNGEMLADLQPDDLEEFGVGNQHERELLLKKVADAIANGVEIVSSVDARRAEESPTSAVAPSPVDKSRHQMSCHTPRTASAASESSQACKFDALHGSITNILTRHVELCQSAGLSPEVAASALRQAGLADYFVSIAGRLHHQ